jgi:hypothetical protein
MTSDGNNFAMNEGWFEAPIALVYHYCKDPLLIAALAEQEHIFALYRGDPPEPEMEMSAQRVRREKQVDTN